MLVMSHKNFAFPSGANSLWTGVLWDGINSIPDETVIPL
jgi:hypothetical protein